MIYYGDERITMPTYVYKSCDGDSDPEVAIERIVPIAERDNQYCTRCNTKLERVIVFTGLTWAPTASETGFK
jgi:predicted nucleic acid-binding Zn ribbon protein